VALTGLSLPLRQVDGGLHDIGHVLFYVYQATLAVAVAMTLWSGYEFFRDVWRQRDRIRAT
jgi:CDP-diacylglycerol--glycerol-3-phosphate 3-phosphatidyltransferase